MVAVSKYMPAEDIEYATKTGQTHFGENYVILFPEVYLNVLTLY